MQNLNRLIIQTTHPGQSISTRSWQFYDWLTQWDEVLSINDKPAIHSTNVNPEFPSLLIARTEKPQSETRVKDKRDFQNSIGRSKNRGESISGND